MPAAEKKEESTLSNKIMQNIFLYINRDETRKQLQMFLVDPLLNHVMDRILPYIFFNLYISCNSFNPCRPYPWNCALSTPEAYCGQMNP